MQRYYAEMVARKISLAEERSLNERFERVSNTEAVGEVVGGDNVLSKKRYTAFCYNDYFSLSFDPEILNAAKSAIDEFGTGACASKHVFGQHPFAAKLQELLSNYYSCDNCLLFSSGYSAAFSTIAALVQSEDLIVSDKLIHACEVDGAALSGATLRRFAHNNYEHLRQILQKDRNKYKKCLILTESLFSMDGDFANLEKLANIAEEYNGMLLVDTAHSFGLKTPPREMLRNFGRNVIYLGTLSKAMVSVGGYVCANETIIDYLQNFARSQIYSTALPPHCISIAIAAFNSIVHNKNSCIDKLISNASYARSLLPTATSNDLAGSATGDSWPSTWSLTLPPSLSPIVILHLKTNKLSIAAQENLKESGFLVKAIRTPTSPTPRLRIVLNSSHTHDQIKTLVSALSLYFCSIA